MAFKFDKLDIEGPLLITPEKMEDERGSYINMYREKDFKENGISENFIVHAESNSKKGVLRGLHYQNHPKAYARLVELVEGEILDVVVDIRKNSENYGKHVKINLSDKDRKIVYVPIGFAHGFYVLGENAKMRYSYSCLHSPEHDKGIIWNDKTLNIDWPISGPMIISKRDQAFPTLENAVNDFNK